MTSTHTAATLPNAAEARTLPDGAVEIRGLSLEEIWEIAHSDSFIYDGRDYVPMLSYLEEGPVGEPVLYLSRDYT